MKRTVLSCLVLVLVAATALPARAVLTCTEPDLFALVFDNGDVNLTPATFAQFTMRAVLLNPSASPIDAFEFKLVMPSPAGQLYVLQETLPPGSINVGNWDNAYREYIVGFPTPRPAVGGRIEMVSFNLMCIASTANQDFYVQPTMIPSIPGRLAYNVTTGSQANLHAMNPVSGSFAAPVARLYPSTQLAFCAGGPDYTEMQIGITTTAGSVRDPLAVAGADESATDGFDAALEHPEPVLPPANYVCTSFEHAAWPLGPRFDNDIRGVFDPGAVQRTWPLLVETDRDDLVTMEFTPSFDAGDNYHLALRDLQSGLVLPLFPGLTHSWRNHGLPTARRLELQVGARTVPQLTPANRTVPAGWSLVSLPLEPPAGYTLGALLLDLAPGYAFAYTYDQTNGYVPVAREAYPTMGAGYWLGTSLQYTYYMNGSKPLDGRVIATRPGWNLVGYPNWTAGSASRLIVRHDGESMTWAAAAQAGLVSPDVQGYSSATGAYVDAEVLIPYQGYWVNVLVPDVEILVFWRNFEGFAKDQAAAKRPAPGTPDAWRTDFVLSDAGGSERTVTLGVDPAGTSGFDVLLDRPQPPAAPVPGPLFCVQHPDWGLEAGSRFTRDLVGPATAPLSWSLTCASPVAGAATLRWDTTLWPSELDLQLYLPDENRVLLRSLRDRSSINVPLGNGPVTVVVRTPVEASGVGDLPVAVAGTLEVHPNPFNPQATLSFTMAQPGTAEVRIYSLRGELVRVLGGGAVAAGPQQLVWDGTDAHGRAVPSGSYFGRLQVDGAISGETVRMSLVR